MTNRKSAYWVIPPKAAGALVAHLEVVLATYAQPDAARFPVWCLDEQPVPLLKETRVPRAAPPPPRRVAYADERAGTASLFLVGAPRAGWRPVSVRERRTKSDWAVAMAALVRGRYATAAKGILVCANLHTHTLGACDEACDPATAWSLRSRLECRPTPKHGSWLNLAENAWSARTRRGVPGRRCATTGPLREETAAWHQHTNDKQRGVAGQFRSDDARRKLKSLYPKIKG